MWQFNSVTKPLVVFAAVPFGLAAGMMGLLIFGVPFGFMAFLGIASLAGVIVSHIIVLFDYIEDAHERGLPLRRAVIDSAPCPLAACPGDGPGHGWRLDPAGSQGRAVMGTHVLRANRRAAGRHIGHEVVVPVLYVLFVERPQDHSSKKICARLSAQKMAWSSSWLNSGFAKSSLWPRDV